MTGTAEAEVLQAAAQLVARFAAHDTEAYFAAFAPDASFIFPTTPEILPSCAAYEKLWREWESRDGFRVLGCRSTEQSVTVHGETAIFTHNVATHLAFNDGETLAQERETIVFRRQPNHAWLAIHEHLSPLPDSTTNKIAGDAS
jgi:ketosteroid isomerase-like protein